MISILIPIYNRAHLIEETLESIKAQTHSDWECIIIDDESTDDTYAKCIELTKNDKRFKIYKRKANLLKGPSSCRNYAVSLSNGEFIQFFDSDDIMHPDHLKLKYKTIEHADLVVCKLMSFSIKYSEDLLEKETSEILKPHSNFFEAFAIGNFEMMMVAPMWKKETLEQFLPIREDLHLLEDHDLHARALHKGLDVRIINKSLIYYRTNINSTTNNFYKDLNTGLDSYLEAKSTVLNLGNSNIIKLAILKNILGFFRAALATRNFSAANTCLKFISNKHLVFNFNLKLKICRIKISYQLFKIFKKGDTFFKPLFKL